MKLFTQFTLSFIFIAGLSLSTQSQNTNQVTFPFQQSFSIDSLKGFDEAAAAKSAISEQFIGPELKVRMYQLKRQYINNKYNIKATPTEHIFLSTSSNKSSAMPGCINEDFEATPAGPITGTNQVVTGWTLVAGTHTTNMATNNSCNLLGCCPNNVYESVVFTTTGNVGYIDPVIGPIYPIFSVFGTNQGPANATSSNTQIPGGMYGNTFFRLNSSNNNYSIEKLSKTFQVTANNALFKFAFINVISNGHACCDASSFKVQLINATTNSVIANSGYSVSGLSAQCNNTSWVTYYDPLTFVPSTTNSFYMFNPWQFNFIDLTPYIGQNVTIDVIASDCTAGGHYSYTYFDAQCGPVMIEMNGAAAPGNSVSCVPTATLSAPANMPYYKWVGPGTFSSTSQIVTANVSGDYTLTLNQAAPLPALVAVLPLKIAPVNLQVSSASNTICEGQSVNLSAIGAVSYTWNTGSNNANITVNPSSTTTYTVSGTSVDGCVATSVITQVVSQCAGITQMNGQSKSAGLFPNPNKGSFVLNLYENVTKAEFTVMDVLGKVIYKQFVQSGENAIRIPGLITGIYYYSINSSDRLLASGRFNVE